MDILRCMDMFLITKILTCVVYRKISQTLSYLEYICSLSSPLRDHGSRFARSLRSLNREDSDKYPLTITYWLTYTLF